MSNKALSAKHEPLVRIVKRDGQSVARRILVRVAAIVLALVVDALFIYFVTGLNPLDVYRVMFGGSFGSKIRFWWTMRDLVTLLLVGIALAAGVYNALLEHWRRGTDSGGRRGPAPCAWSIWGIKFPSGVLFCWPWPLTSIAVGAPVGAHSRLFSRPTGIPTRPCLP